MILQRMSASEYLRSEELSAFRRKYVGGFAYPLHGGTADTAGTSAAHNLIGGSIAAALLVPARLRGLRVSAFTLRLAIPAALSFYYPDVMVFPSGPDAGQVSGPLVLVEVLSEHTALRDRLEKYAAYTALPGLLAYLIVEQTEQRVYVYTREEESWGSEDLAGSGSIDLTCLGVRLSLDEIYECVSG